MSSNNVERRTLTTELRASKDKRKIAGYASVYSRDSEDLGGFVEQIAPGAFDDVLASKPDVRCLLNHDPSSLLGRTTSGTLRLRTDSVGLFYECDVPDTGVGRDLLVSAERGDISQSSFGFVVGEDQWYDLSGNKTARWSGSRRVITRVAQLFDVSPVTYPAYPDATVQARNLANTTEAARAEARRFIAENDARRDALKTLAQADIDRLRRSI